MSNALLFAVAVAYAVVAVRHGWQGNAGQAIAWAAYALANIGFILDNIGRGLQ